MVPAGPSPSLGRQTAAVSCQSSRPSRRDSPRPRKWGAQGSLLSLLTCLLSTLHALPRHRAAGCPLFPPESQS